MVKVNFRNKIKELMIIALHAYLYNREAVAEWKNIQIKSYTSSRRSRELHERFCN